jgi:hypothetical protein
MPGAPPGVVCAFNCLSDELLQHVLGFVGCRWLLTRVSAVNTRWRFQCTQLLTSLTAPAHSASRHVALPHSIALFRTENAHTLIKWIRSIAERFRIVRLPPLSGAMSPFALQFPDASVVSVLKRCPDLHEWEIGWDAIEAAGRCTAEILDVLATTCPQLCSVMIWRDGVTDDSVGRIAAGCTDLVHITCKATTLLTDTSLAALGTHCAKLESVLLVCIENESDAGHCGITDVGVTALVKGCGDLTELSLVDGIVAVSDEGLQAIAAHCPKLRVCRMGTPFEPLCYTDVGVASLAQGCPRLETISFAGPTHLTDASLDAIATWCPRLTSLCVHASAVTDIGVLAVLRACPELAHVDLSETAISDGLVTQLVAQCGKLESLTCIRCNRLTDASITFLVQHRDRGFAINLTDCPNISEFADDLIRKTFPTSPYQY